MEIWHHSVRNERAPFNKLRRRTRTSEHGPQVEELSAIIKLMLNQKLPRFQWTQDRADSDGEAASDLSGCLPPTATKFPLIMIVYDWDGTPWTQVGTDNDRETANDQF